MPGKIQFKCLCIGAASHWIGMPPESPHRHKVQCGACGKFIKWGKDEELHERVASRDKVTVSSYDPDEHVPKLTIYDFLADQQ